MCIDAKNKNENKKVSDNLSMTLDNVFILREASLEGGKSKKSFRDGASLIKDALND